MSTPTVDGDDVILIVRKHGDSTLKAVIVNDPLRMPPSIIVSLCRYFDFPVEEFDIEAHDL